MTRRMSRTKALSLLAAGTLSLTAGAVGIATSIAHAEDANGSGFQSLSLVAEAAGQRVVFTEKETGQKDGFAEADVPFAQANLTTTSAYGLGSVGWPGSAAGNLGSFYTLLTGDKPAPLPVNANSPVRAEARTGSGQPTDVNTLPGGNMSAKATDDTAEAEARIGGSTNVNIGKAGTTHVLSTSKATGVSEAVADAQSTVEDIDMASGLITIGSVTSHARVTTNGTTSDGSGSTHVSKMKVATIPVTVDQDGVHVQGQGATTKAQQKAINDAMKESGTEIRLTEPKETTSDAGTSYDSGSLVISFDSGGFYVLLGGARAVGGSTLGTVFTPPPGATNSPAPFIPGSPAIPGTPGVPGAGITGTPGSPTDNGTQPNAPAPVLAGNRLPLGGGLSPAWLLFVLLGAGFIAVGMRALPIRLLEETPTPCALGDQP